MNRLVSISAVCTLGLCARTLSAATVAYWPLAYEEDVRTTTETEFVDEVGGLVAKPISMNGGEVIAGSDYCPLGTTGFPSGFGVWNPQASTKQAFDAALRFANPTYNGNAGALKVESVSSKLRLTTFTFETFVRMTSKGGGRPDGASSP